ncbi:hypothetical protein TNCV_3187301 [Trichonephila clavipes]|nr:hypothetical protein TNCV_3187301 [Trichonephila clavipes]
MARHKPKKPTTVEYIMDEEDMITYDVDVDEFALKNDFTLCPDLGGEKDFNDDHREESTDFVQSIPGFQECNEDVETPGWHVMQKTVDFKC